MDFSHPGKTHRQKIVNIPMALLSVLIANYNNGHFFEEAYRSLLRQTSDQWEAIVIDDASTDNSVEVIQGLIRGDHRFRFYRNERNLGYQQTLIRAIELSEAEIFGRLDPDDALYPEAVELSLIEHKNYPEAGLIYSDITICNEHLRILRHHKSFQINTLDEKYFLLAGEIGAFATFKKHIYHQAGGIDSTIKRAEDIDIYIRMCEISPVRRIPQPLYYYRYLPNSLSKGENQDRSYFWHWMTLIKTAERRNLDLENTFVQNIGSRKKLQAYRDRVLYIKDLISKNKVLSTIAMAAHKLGLTRHRI